MRRHRRGGARLSLQLRARPTSPQRVFRAQIGLARELGLPLVIHAREADDDIAAILREEMAAGAFKAAAALFHLLARARRDRARTRPLRLVFRRADVQEFRTSCAQSRATCRWTGCWSRPTRPISRRFRIAAGATSRPSSSIPRRTLAEVKGVDFAALAAATRANTLRLFSKMRGQGVSLALTILGCGSSGGVPRVAQGWGACDPGNPRNRRRRCSVLVERTGRAGKTLVLVDTSPDLRVQLIDADVRRLDGVLMTHAHADHCHGIDDLRPLVIAHAQAHRHLHGRADLARACARSSAIFSRRRPAAPIRRS